MIHVCMVLSLCFDPCDPFISHETSIYGAVGNGILDVTEMDCTIDPNLCNPPKGP